MKYLKYDSFKVRLKLSIKLLIKERTKVHKKIFQQRDDKINICLTLENVLGGWSHFPVVILSHAHRLVYCYWIADCGERVSSTPRPRNGPSRRMTTTSDPLSCTSWTPSTRQVSSNGRGQKVQFKIGTVDLLLVRSNVVNFQCNTIYGQCSKVS